MKQTTINNLHFAIVAVLFFLGFGFLALAVSGQTIGESVALAAMGIAIELISVGLYHKYQAERTLPEDVLEK